MWSTLGGVHDAWGYVVNYIIALNVFLFTKWWNKPKTINYMSWLTFTYHVLTAKSALALETCPWTHHSKLASSTYTTSSMPSTSRLSCYHNALYYTDLAQFWLCLGVRISKEKGRMSKFFNLRKYTLIKEFPKIKRTKW